MADSVEIAKAYVQIVPSMEGAQASIAEGLTGVVPEGEKAGQGLGSSLLASLEGSLGKFVAPAAVAAALAELGKLAFDLGESFDSAYDSIRTGTGATGEDLDALKDSFLNVKNEVPAATQDIANALADLNTRTGATGETLEDLTKKFMELDEVGYSMDIGKATGMMNAWGIATEDMSGKLDELFVVSQSTGISMDALSSSMSSNAASMQELGFSFEETAVLAGQFDKAGLDANSMMGRLSKAMTTLATDGKAPAEAFNESLDAMRGFISEGDRAAAIDLASELFGTKGAAQFIQALETGTLDTEALMDAVSDASGAIDDNAESTRSWSESLDLLKNKAEVALEPFATGVFDGLSALLDGAVQGFDSASEAVSGFLDAFLSNEYVVEVLTAIQEAMQAVGEVGESAFSLLASAAATLSPILTPLASLVQGALSTAFNLIAGILSGAVKGALDGVKTAAETVKTGLDRLNSLISGLKFELPRFALPHFNIYGGELPWGIGGMGSAPSVSVDWYARGGIVDGASLIGVGEAGPEAIVPISGDNMRPFSDAIAENLGMFDGRLLREVESLHADLYSIIRAASPDMSMRQFGRLVRQAT